MSEMEAVWFERCGPAAQVLAVGTLPRPEPEAGEVLVRVMASGVNPSDVKQRAGLRPGGLPFECIIPHSDGAGIIEAVGGGVSEARIGQRVWVWNAQWQRPFGTCAQYCALPDEQAVPLPDVTSYAAGACLGIPAMTAYDALFSAGPVTDKTVLVQGGAGAVGHYAVQMAKHGGATVIATTSGGAKAEHAQAAGADYLLNYQDDDVAGSALEITNGRGIDLIIEVEFGQNIDAIKRMIAVGGVIAAYGSARVMNPTFPFGEFLFKNVTVRTLLVYAMPAGKRAEAAAKITDWLRQNALQHTIADTFGLTDTAAAHERVEHPAKPGGIVVEIA